MIPAYLRGELPEHERLEVENLAAKNPSIAAEIQFQKNLKTAIRADQDNFEPGELGWAKLSKAMSESDNSSSFEPQITSKQPKFWKYAAAILAVAAIGQAGVLSSLAIKDSSEPQYVTVSETASDLYTVKVGFHSDVTVEQLTETLQSLDAKIISGPSSLGLYDVKFESIATCSTAVESFERLPRVIATATSCE
ncbi:MAG: hypothetical protein ABJN52_07230 [Litorimonas sp.]